jgi:hypothetical protein
MEAPQYAGMIHSQAEQSLKVAVDRKYRDQDASSPAAESISVHLRF